MTEIERLKEIVQTLRSDHGCPWDREQTHASLKPECIEEAAEVVCGINILEKTGNAENLKEELGDLLLQVMFHAVMAEEETVSQPEEPRSQPAGSPDEKAKFSPLVPKLH